MANTCPSTVCKLPLNLFRTCSLQELLELPGPIPTNLNVNNQLTLAWVNRTEMVKYTINFAASEGYK
jgi:hypothetical protein